MEKIRCSKSVFTRDDQYHSWVEQKFDTLGAAKRANGLHSKTVNSPKDLPKKLAKPK